MIYAALTYNKRRWRNQSLRNIERLY